MRSHSEISKQTYRGFILVGMNYAAAHFGKDEAEREKEKE